MTRTECAQVLAYLVSAWPQVELSDETVEVWADQLGGVAYVDAEPAARRLVSSSKWFPSPSEFLEHAQAEARSRRSHDRELPPAPSMVDEGSAPSCPRCQRRDQIERLTSAVMGHTLLCGGCWTTFGGSTGEWERMARDRHKWNERERLREQLKEGQ